MSNDFDDKMKITFVIIFEMTFGGTAWLQFNNCLNVSKNEFRKILTILLDSR